MAEATASTPKRPLPKSRVMVNEQIEKVYADAWEAKRQGKPVGWSTSIFPQEICETFGVPVLYPENNAAANGAKRYGDPLIEHAEGKMRFPANICSYARLNLGMADLFDQDFPLDPAMPRPDFLLLANNSCTQLIKWYENLARNLNIPVFFLDCLFNYDEEEPAHYKIKYVRQQLDDYIKNLEAFLGKKLDWDKFVEVQKISRKNCELFVKVGSLNSHVPAPLSGFDLFNYMAPLVMCRGKEATTESLLQLEAEMKEHIASSTSTFPTKEEFRVQWEGIACWANLSASLKTLKKYGVNAVMNGYVTAWNVKYEPGDLDSFARAYMFSSSGSFNTSAIMKKRMDNINQFSCEGMLCHLNKSCKVACFNILIGREIVERELGVPCVSFDGDQTDSTIFNEAQYETRIQGMVEIMKERKNAK